MKLNIGIINIASFCLNEIMSKYELYSVVISSISVLIALGAWLHSIHVNRKHYLKKIKKVSYLCDRNGYKCKNIEECDKLVICFTNIGNRNIEFVFAEIKVGRKKMIDGHLINKSVNLDIDKTHKFDSYLLNISNFLFFEKDGIKKNYKLTIIFYDSAHKKYKVKFKIKLNDILKYRENYYKEKFE